MKRLLLSICALAAASCVTMTPAVAQSPPLCQKKNPGAIVTTPIPGDTIVRCDLKAGAVTYHIVVPAIPKAPPIVTPEPPAPPTGTGEPTYDSTQHALVLRDAFEYADIAAARRAYPANRGTEYMELTAGRTGKAARLKYGVGGADDIVFGPEGMLGSVGHWGNGLPQKAGPYQHFYFTTWFRLSSGADPASTNGWGVKGFMFWHSGGRYQNAINRAWQDERSRGPKGANPDNAQSGLALYQTPDGRAPLLGTLADGQWHRFTIEIHAGVSSRGEAYWIDGKPIYNDIDKLVGPGTKADHYDYAHAITHWMVFGNFIGPEARSPFFTFDVDDWMAWTPR